MDHNSHERSHRPNMLVLSGLFREKGFSSFHPGHFQASLLDNI